MVAVGPHRPPSAEQSVHEAGDPDGQPAHTTLEPRRPIRFHQQVQMILLNAELENAEAPVGSRAKRVLNWSQKPFGAEGRDV